jgi:mannose-6-phosphate isomerase-like protein (cupin superfamily)
MIVAKKQGATTAKPYALADGKGRAYEWRDILFTIKAAAAETGGALAFWEVTTRPGEEPHTHTHVDVDEIFYVLSGSITFRCGRRSFLVEKNGFVYLPRGIPHSYTIHSRRVRMLGLSTPSAFGDNIERTGKPVKPERKRGAASAKR